MKYFEFNQAEYYALIGAKDIDSAMDYYKETVSDLEESDGFPGEITKTEAKIKLCNACEKTKEDIQFVTQVVTQAFEESANKSAPFLVLVDGSLM